MKGFLPGKVSVVVGGSSQTSLVEFYPWRRESPLSEGKGSVLSSKPKCSLGERTTPCQSGRPDSARRKQTGVCPESRDGVGRGLVLFVTFDSGLPRVPNSPCRRQLVDELSRSRMSPGTSVLRVSGFSSRLPLPQGFKWGGRGGEGRDGSYEISWRSRDDRGGRRGRRRNTTLHTHTRDERSSKNRQERVPV